MSIGLEPRCHASRSGCGHRAGPPPSDLLVQTLAAAPCCHGTKPPTGSARAEAENPRGREPAAASNFPHLSSSTGSLISCPRRGSTGIATTPE